MRLLRRPRSRTPALGAALRQALRRAGVVVISFGLTSVLLQGTGIVDVPGVLAVKPAQESRAKTHLAGLLRTHHCWTGAAPADLAGEVPGHVVVTVRGRTTYSARMVGPALEHVFTRARPGWRVHAFCR